MSQQRTDAGQLRYNLERHIQGFEKRVTWISSEKVRITVKLRNLTLTINIGRNQHGNWHIANTQQVGSRRVPGTLVKTLRSVCNRNRISNLSALDVLNAL